MLKVKFKPKIMIALFLSTSAPNFAQEFKPKKVSGQEGYKLVSSKKCDIHLSFGSYGSGTPTKVIKSITKYLNELKGIKASYTWSWGMEGEFDYCLVLTNQDRTQDVYNDLKGHIPEFSKKGYTKLKSKAGKSWATTWPK